MSIDLAKTSAGTPTGASLDRHAHLGEQPDASDSAQIEGLATMLSRMGEGPEAVAARIAAIHEQILRITSGPRVSEVPDRVDRRVAEVRQAVMAFLTRTTVDHERRIAQLEAAH